MPNIEVQLPDSPINRIKRQISKRSPVQTRSKKMQIRKPNKNILKLEEKESDIQEETVVERNTGTSTENTKRPLNKVTEEIKRQTLKRSPVQTRSKKLGTTNEEEVNKDANQPSNTSSQSHPSNRPLGKIRNQIPNRSPVQTRSKKSFPRKSTEAQMIAEKKPTLHTQKHRIQEVQCVNPSQIRAELMAERTEPEMERPAGFRPEGSV